MSSTLTRPRLEAVESPRDTLRAALAPSTTAPSEPSVSASDTESFESDARRVVEAGVVTSSLRDLIVDAVCTALPSTGALLGASIERAIESFVAAGARVAPALHAVGEDMRRLGEGHARRGGEQQLLVAAFEAASCEAVRRLASHLAAGGTRDTLLELQAAVAHYVHALGDLAMQGWAQAAHLGGLDETGQRALLGAAMAGRASATMIGPAARMLRIDPRTQMRPVVALCGALPPQLRRHPEVLAAPSSAEAFVPGSWGEEQLLGLLHGPVVVGPARDLEAARENVDLARRVAERAREVHGPTMSTAPALWRTSDHLDLLILAPGSLLAELAMEKHLAPLAELPLRRRVPVAEVALGFLEHGVSKSRLAALLGLPVQTVHSRLAVAARHLGIAMEDPAQRLELIIALRTALPRWLDADQLAG